MKEFTHLGLFEGIGGFSLAARWAGWKTLAWCEWNEFGQKVLKHHFPEAEGFGDITKTDFTKYAGKIDILTGGFPCQPYSAAGKRLGKDDERHLWPEMLRAIREVSPSWVVGENVRGLTNWNGGLVFDEVQADLEAEGYEVLPFLLPACGVGAPHRRDRIWFVAYSSGSGTGSSSRGFNESRELLQKTERKENKQFDKSFSESWNVTKSSSIGCNNGSDNRQERHVQGNEGIASESESERQGRECGIGEASSTAANSDSRRQSSEEHGQAEPGRASKEVFSNYWENFPTQSPICGGNDGLPTKLDGITFPKWRNESIKAYGNAIVPQVAYEIFKAINAFYTS